MSVRLTKKYKLVQHLYINTQIQTAAQDNTAVIVPPKIFAFLVNVSTAGGTFSLFPI